MRTDSNQGWYCCSTHALSLSPTLTLIFAGVFLELIDSESLLLLLLYVSVMGISPVGERVWGVRGMEEGIENE